MKDEKRKLGPPLRLDMDFDEAVRRFAQTDPEEVEPPKGKTPKVAKASKGAVATARAKAESRKPVE